MTWRAIQTALALLLGLLLANGAAGQDRPSVSSTQLVHEQQAREAYRAILDQQMQRGAGRIGLGESAAYALH
jgi:hypothetical protein